MDAEQHLFAYFCLYKQTRKLCLSASCCLYVCLCVCVCACVCSFTVLSHLSCVTFHLSASPLPVLSSLLLNAALLSEQLLSYLHLILCLSVSVSLCLSQCIPASSLISVPKYHSAFHNRNRRWKENKNERKIRELWRNYNNL